MTETPDQPLGDDDIQTEGMTSGGAPQLGDTDGTDGDATDAVDGDATGSDTDGTDGDTTDAVDGDTSDADGTDGTDTASA